MFGVHMGLFSALGRIQKLTKNAWNRKCLIINILSNILCEFEATRLQGNLSRLYSGEGVSALNGGIGELVVSVMILLLHQTIKHK